MTQPNGHTVPDMPMPPVIPGNGEEIAGSPWLTDPKHSDRQVPVVDVPLVPA